MCSGYPQCLDGSSKGHAHQPVLTDSLSVSGNEWPPLEIWEILITFDTPYLVSYNRPNNR
ncbi:hypothetical protein BDN70DRAFT_886490 [Pholiota conissans]|uniref:Uncharacterized protein n=1 Tax=Pholiota conissans TaxID=109636 RepID=A0A9P5YSG1_9AGAR|nr:hypothetical protein BDN70DRAFT_886490 [Pholiota conissans]